MANFSEFNWNENENKKTANNEDRVEKQKLEELINKYSSLDSNSLIKEFMKMTMEKKQRGELSDSELNSIAEMILPYLDDKQKQSLKTLMEVVKNVWENRQKTTWKNWDFEFKI